MTFIVKCAPVLKEWKFCCCTCSLRAAAIVLAWFSLVTNISQFVTSVIYLAHPHLRAYSPYDSKELIITVLSSVVGAILLDVLLLYGIHNKRPMYMLPYLVLDLIGIITLTAIVVIGGLLISVSNWAAGLTILIVGSAVVALISFLWVVLYSYYRQIEEEKNSNYGVVNFTYGVPPNDQVQTMDTEDKKCLYPYPNKLAPEVA